MTTSFARELLPAVAGATPVQESSRRALESWWRRCEAALGPTSHVRTVADVAFVPLMRVLGFTVARRVDEPDSCVLELVAGARCAAAGLVTGWGAPSGAAWRTAVHRSIARDTRWCFCCNGVVLRVVDARRTWSRDYLEFDLEAAAREPSAQAMFWGLLRAEAMATEPPVLDRATLLSARHGVETCRALGTGVLDALQRLVGALAARARGRYAADLLLEHSLTVLYRVLFLLFAEARSLVPMWHPVYRDQYSLEEIVGVLLSGRRYRGLWGAVQAISRLAHAGCAAGELTVTAFNGRLFSPSQAAAFDRTPIDDDTLGRAIVAVSTTARGGARARIAYRDLDVEQLGAVYEQVLDYQPALDAPAALVRTGDTRKSSGTFYTPRAVTGWLVRRTLEPLVAGRSAEEILRLRVLDPAMGSGAFLVAACRYLAGALEEALIREGTWHSHDVHAAERVLLRRQVAAQCLFGVDVNPMAVQLARLSIWLATLSGDKPLSFLDHHLVAGDSLVGATPEDLLRQPSRAGRRGVRPAALPLMEAAGLTATLGQGVQVRTKLAADADDSAATVRLKERTLTALHARDTGLGRWSRALDLWCAGWFWDAGEPPDRRTFGTLVDDVLHGRQVLPVSATARLLARSEAIAAARRFLHWPLVFPEIFVNERGEGLTRPGFDAILGNPPWDMVRGDSGAAAARGGRRLDARRLTDFVREAGVYRIGARAHANRYQLFVERALQLIRPGGRIGLVLPAGVIGDAGSAPLRRHLLDHAAVDELVGLDNRAAIFPIHRSVRFVLLTCTAGPSTDQISCRFGLTRPEELEEATPPGNRAPLMLTRSFLSRLSGDDDLGIPELASADDLRIVERISSAIPRLAARDGWGVRFGRELNAADDRDSFTTYAGDPAARPVVEGKQIEPFRVSLERCGLQLQEGSRDRQIPRRARLAYRDVASATNRLTLIAAIVPARAVTTHTLFCLKTPLPVATQHVLCALLNSYVANYLVRLRVNTHVTVALLSRLPVPFLTPGEPAFERLADLARVLSTAAAPVEALDEYARLQAVVAGLYRLTPAELGHILKTFPLVPEETRARVLASFHAAGDATR